MKILLISLQKDIDTLGLKYIHYTLMKGGYDSTLLYLPGFEAGDLRAMEKADAFIGTQQPALIGISLMSHEYGSACALTEHIKRKNPGIPVIWGGIHPSISPEECLKHADYVSVGESERTALDIAKALSERKDIRGINNICHMKDGSVVRNPLYPLIEDLDSIPAFEHIPKKTYIYDGEGISPLDKSNFRKFARHLGTTYSILTTRGCPYFCTYCCSSFLASLYKSNKLRRRSISNIIDELEAAVRDNPELEYINFQDDCFSACSDAYLKEFCETYRKKIGKPFIIRAIPTYVTDSKIGYMKDAGLAWISLGLQSGSDRVCREVYKRKSFNKDFLEAAGIIKKFRIAAFYDVLVDNPFEEEEDIFETIRVLADTPRPFYPQFYSLTFYYGTELYDRAKKECPEYIEDYKKKDFLIVHKTTINNIIRIAPFIHKSVVAWIVRLYRSDRNSALLKAALPVLNVTISFVIEPLTYFRLIKASQSGSLAKTIKVLPNYFREGMRRYTKRFKKAIWERKA